MQAITHTDGERERERDILQRHRDSYTQKDRKFERERERESFYKKVLCIETYKKKERENGKE